MEPLPSHQRRTSTESTVLAVLAILLHHFAYSYVCFLILSSVRTWSQQESYIEAWSFGIPLRTASAKAPWLWRLSVKNSFGSWLIGWVRLGAATLRLELHEVLSARKTLFFQVCIIASSFTGLNHSPCSCRCFLQTRKAGSRAPEAFQSYGAFGMASIGWRATPCTKFGHISRCP